MITLLFAVIMAALLGCEGVENTMSKEEYGVLQVVEYEHRQTPVSGVEVIEKNGYLVAGFRPDGVDENVWVLLNARYVPYYKQMPDTSFKVSRETLDTIRRTRGVRKDVLAALEDRLSSQVQRKP
jgi:hypothetical protein